ncbi:MAG: type I DNA topoisomerase [Actinomycetota bacterium]|nr:type I DNA topoisomerase [Actinomycetota bacterium]MEE3353918.1 type I DNA topoisomerase [Actinomycetota bacterium]
MGDALVIVESPAKAKTIAGYLGDGFVVESSIGHVRDLPMRASDVPAAYKGEPWAKTGVDVDNDFKPLYVVNADKKQQMANLKRLLKKADVLYLATDEDREGEAIAWHLLEVLNPKVPVHRMVFHEITKGAITEALDNTRELDRRLVDAQETRRILDRLYGYELSPVLWRMIGAGLSAGRVQSVATRMIVERERERMAFRSADYWDLDCTLATRGFDASIEFTARLQEIDGCRVALGRDFGDDGQPSRDDVLVLEEVSAGVVRDDLEGASAIVESVEPKPYTRRPSAPFTTSTFQQEAGRRLKLSASRAMHAAQGLYQKGYITYMRTDSTTLSDTAIQAARAEAAERFGPDHVTDAPRTYANKVRNAQEAHEAIRPAGDRFRHPDTVRDELPKSEADVYEMVWRRTVASQMTDVRGETVRLRMGADLASSVVGARATLTSSGTVIHHQGFRRVYEETREDTRGEQAEAGESVLPAVTVGEVVDVVMAVAEGHTTQPPARYTEASLVKGMEEHGVGRPSTYASIMETIQRKYVFKKGTALVPTLSAFAVTNLLERHFPRMVDYDFTASMEEDLDDIANGEAESVPWLTSFYFGSDDDIGLHAKVTTRLGDIDPREVSTVELGATSDGEPVVARFGKFGPYVQVGDETASIPDDVPPDELTVAKALEFLHAPADRELGVDPESDLVVVARSGRFGPYVSLGRPPERPSPSSPAGRIMALPGNRKELDVALGYLRLAAGRLDSKSVKKVLNVPARGVSAAAVKKVVAAVEAGRPVMDVLRDAGSLDISSKAVTGVEAFLAFGEGLAELRAEGPRAVIQAAIEGSGYGDEIRAAEDGGASRLENLEKLVDAVDGFEDLEFLLDELDRQTAFDDLPKPKTASLFQTMTLERITFDEAMQLLSLPRTVGVDPADGVEVTVHNGPYGPYLKKGSDSRNIESEEQLLTITLEECLALLAQPKRRGRNAPKPPLRELGVDPESGKTMVLKDGNWGPYVTDGEYNASLKRGDAVEELTDERAAELLAERRMKGPAKKKR